MARVRCAIQSVRALTGGLDQVEVDADSVRGLIAALERQFPGLGEIVRTQMALAIDGEIHHDALAEPLSPDAEVVLIPRLVAG
jgi:molybdopterin converting factor small subunit